MHHLCMHCSPLLLSHSFGTIIYGKLINVVTISKLLGYIGIVDMTMLP